MRVNSPDDRITELEAMLQRLLDCGEWYSSALEIDTYNGPDRDGLELEKEIKQLLSRPAPVMSRPS